MQLLSAVLTVAAAIATSSHRAGEQAVALPLHEGNAATDALRPQHAATTAIVPPPRLGNATAIVQAHVAAAIRDTFREPAGVLTFPYLVPAGPYQTSWDWDGLFLGVVASGSAYGNGSAYFAGTFKNYLQQTNLTNGELPGGLSPNGSTGVLYHAKPVIIGGAWLAATVTGDYAGFKQFQPQMQALLSYWNSSARTDKATGLPLWHDQLETGADNLVYSLCPSAYSTDCWVEADDAFTLSSPDLLVWIAREHTAYSNFLRAWGAATDDAEVLVHTARVVQLTDLLNTYLWYWEDQQMEEAAPPRGYYVAYNVSTGAQIRNRTYQMGWPLWANMTAYPNQTQAVIAALLADDMVGPNGVRSTSSADPRYNNNNIIIPYSNWRGPIWINANAVVAYALNTHGAGAAAAAIADAVVQVLADDLTLNGEWHECYNAENGTALAAPGFLSWDTLGARLQADIAEGRDPFSLAYTL